MWHGAFLGMTGTGKTFAAQQMGAQFRRDGIGVLALHKPLEFWPRGSVSWQTDNPETFLRMFWASRGCACFMELADADVSKWDARFHRCFQKGRHYGHRCYYLTQRAASVHPAIRENCDSLHLFTVGGAAARLWAEEMNDSALLGAVDLDPHFFLWKRTRFTPAQVRCLTA